MNISLIHSCIYSLHTKPFKVYNLNVQQSSHSYYNYKANRCGLSHSKIMNLIVPRNTECLKALITEKITELNDERINLNERPSRKLCVAQKLAHDITWYTLLEGQHNFHPSLTPIRNARISRIYTRELGERVPV